jgi:hypothetical protein
VSQPEPAPMMRFLGTVGNLAIQSLTCCTHWSVSVLKPCGSLWTCPSIEIADFWDDPARRSPY